MRYISLRISRVRLYETRRLRIIIILIFLKFLPNKRNNVSSKCHWTFNFTYLYAISKCIFAQVNVIQANEYVQTRTRYLSIIDTFFFLLFYKKLLLMIIFFFFNECLRGKSVSKTTIGIRSIDHGFNSITRNHLHLNSNEQRDGILLSMIIDFLPFPMTRPLLWNVYDRRERTSVSRSSQSTVLTCILTRDVS